MNRINEIGDTVRGQEMLGRTAERAHQRAQRTSGADKQRHETTEWDAYQTAARNSRKHLDGSGAHFARGRDAEYDEHWDDGRYTWSKKHKSKNESKTMNNKLIRLTESDLHRIVKESVKNIVSEASFASNGYKHRFDPNKRDGDFPLEQPEWTKDPRWQGWTGEDPEWIMKQEKKYPYGGESKQSVRVSEAQLRQIVKESVNKLLKEIQLNELDPRTYASYAAKRQAQGQTNKAKDGEDAAIQAWNKQYGKKDTGTYGNVDDYGDRERIMLNNPYNNKGKYEVRTQYKDRGLGHLSTYRPTMDYNWDTDTEGYETQGKGYQPTQYLGIDDKGTRHYARREQSQQALQGYEVAKQMANNSGKYIKGKGWQ